MDRQIEILKQNGIKDVVVVTGYLSNQVEMALPKTSRTWHYPDYAQTNNLSTLNHAARFLEGDCMILFSDVLCSRRVIRDAANVTSTFSLQVDTTTNRPGTMRIQLEEGRFKSMGQHIPPGYGNGNFIGIASMTGSGARLLRMELEEMTQEGIFAQEYYTSAFSRLAGKGYSIEIRPLAGAKWMEIDTIWDLVWAKLFARYLLD